MDRFWLFETEKKKLTFNPLAPALKKVTMLLRLRTIEPQIQIYWFFYFKKYACSTFIEQIIIALMSAS